MSDDLAKYVKCVWHAATHHWTVTVDLADGTQREVSWIKTHSRKTSIKKMVDGVLASEQLKPAWDMRYGWETAP